MLLPNDYKILVVFKRKTIGLNVWKTLEQR